MSDRYYVMLRAAIVSVVLIGCGEKKGGGQDGPQPIRVSVFEVKSGEAAYFDKYPATVTALNQVEVRAEVSGYVTGIYFKDGQHLRKGEKLYRIDQQQYQAAYEQAVANENVAKANLAKAQEDANRYRDLAKSDAIARQTFEHAIADLRSAKMQVAAAKANVKSVQTNLRYSIIYAPFDGTIGISSVKLGSSITAGQTMLNTVSSDNPMAVDCAVDEKLINRFTDLLQQKTDNRDSTFTILLPDQSVYGYPGHLNLIDRSVDPQTGTIRIRVIFPNPRNLLRAGLTCDLRVQNNTPKNSLLIPYKAVIEQMGEYFVFVVRGTTVSQQRIMLGMSINDMVMVNNGLQVRDQIVTEGMQKLRDNSPVVVTSPTSTPATVSTQNR